MSDNSISKFNVCLFSGPVNLVSTRSLLQGQGFFQLPPWHGCPLLCGPYIDGE